MVKKAKIFVVPINVLPSFEQLHSVILAGGDDAQQALDSYVEWLQQESKLIMKSDLELGEWLVEHGFAHGVCIYCRLGLIQGNDHFCPLSTEPNAYDVESYMNEINWLASKIGNTPFILS